jgi:hypothetical protein
MARDAGFLCCFIVVAVLAGGCGRSTMGSDEVVDVSVGLTSVNGLQLTEAQVAFSLEPLNFTLLGFDQLPTCTSPAEGCHQVAEGVLPSVRIRRLHAYQDGALRVLFVDLLDSDESPALVGR